MQGYTIVTLKIILSMLSLTDKAFQNISRKHVDNFAVLQLHHLICEALPVSLEILGWIVVEIDCFTCFEG